MGLFGEVMVHVTLEMMMEGCLFDNVQCQGLVILPSSFVKPLFLAIYEKTSNLCYLKMCGLENILSEHSFLRWPISATAKLTFPRQNILFHGKTYFSTVSRYFRSGNF